MNVLSQSAVKPGILLADPLAFAMSGVRSIVWKAQVMQDLL